MELNLKCNKKLRISKDKFIEASVMCGSVALSKLYDR